MSYQHGLKAFSATPYGHTSGIDANTVFMDLHFTLKDKVKLAIWIQFEKCYNRDYVLNAMGQSGRTD